MKDTTEEEGQNLCRAVSEAEWKIPKHVVICVSVKHLFRSARAGHDDRGVATQRAMTLDYSWKLFRPRHKSKCQLI